MIQGQAGCERFHADPWSRLQLHVRPSCAMGFHQNNSHHCGLIAALYDWEIKHINIKTAFLNGPLEEELYMRKPEILGPGYWKLEKGLYGLRQAGCQWYLDLNDKFGEISFKRAESDWCVHLRSDGPSKSITATSVDDILLTSSTVGESDAATKDIKSKYDSMENTGELLLVGLL